MTAPPPRRPWWKRRRWRFAIACWFALPPLYALSLGPAIYAVNRDWLPGRAADSWFAPLGPAMRLSPGFRDAFLRYQTWWVELGYRHGRADGD